VSDHASVGAILEVREIWMREIPVIKPTVVAALAVVGLAVAASAQVVTPNPTGYTYEFRIIADGDAGAPSGLWTQRPLSNTATQIGFWIQARVAQSVGENWGIVRVSPPAAPNTSFITMTDPVGLSSIQRGAINNPANPANTLHGRGVGYRTGGFNNGPSANTAGSAAFPGVSLNENGALDNGGSGAFNDRIFSFDSYVDGTRADTDVDGDGDVDDDGDGFAENPWGVNGSAHPLNVDGTPIPSDGVTFSPWANIYRFVVMPTDVNQQRTILIDAYAQIQGALQSAPTQAGSSTFAMQVGPGRSMFAPTYSFTWGVPTPGAAALMGMGMLAAARRRR